MFDCWVKEVTHLVKQGSIVDRIQLQTGICWRDWRTVFLQSDTAVAIFSLLIFCGYYSRAATIQGWRLFLWEAYIHQGWLDKVCMSDTAMAVRRCQ